MSNLVFPTFGGNVHVSREIVPSWLTDTSLAQYETRYSWAASPRYRYRIGLNVVRSDALKKDLQALHAFYVAHFGGLDSFLLSDPEDNSITDHGFGVGDGSTTAFQLQRRMVGSAVYDNAGSPWSQSSKPRSNLVLQSQALNAAQWTPTAATVSANAASAPDGTVTADKLVESATTAIHRINAAAFDTVVERPYTFSIYAKAAGRDTLRMVFGTSEYADFDLTAQSVLLITNSGTGGIQSVGGGWYRCYFTRPAWAESSGVALQLSRGVSYAGDGTSGMYLWGAQVEQASADGLPTGYIPTTTAAVTVTPSYWPATADAFEPVTDLVPNTLIDYEDGAAKTLTTHYTVSSSGVVTFVSPPASGSVLSWTGSFYRRVRFADGSLSLERIVNQIWKGDLQLVSVLGES